MDIEAGNLRISSWRIHCSLVTKPLSIEQYWPLRGDKVQEKEQLVMTPEMMEEIKRVHKIN